MQFWTHHPSGVRLDDPSLQIDPTLGQYWNSTDPTLMYREVLPILQKRIKKDQFLWCCTQRGLYLPQCEPSDLVEWEITLPVSDVVLINVPAWEELVWGRSNDWEALFLAEGDQSEIPSKDVNALVFLPLSKDCVKCHGQLPPRYLLSGQGENPAYRKHIESLGYNYFEYHRR